MGFVVLSPFLQKLGRVESNLRELEFMKNNYGPVGYTLFLKYRNGLYLPVKGKTSLSAARVSSGLTRCS